MAFDLSPLTPGSRLFGRLADGAPVHAYVLGAPDGLMAEVLSLGCILRRLSLPLPGGGRREVVLPLPDLAAYLADPAFLGQVVGRYANRVGGARFTIDGREHRVTANEGANQLHGGPEGFGRKLWDVVAHDQTSLHLRLISPDGDQGYPGTVTVDARLTAAADSLTLDLRAASDAATPINLTWHPYFNLAGVTVADDILTVGGAAEGRAAVDQVLWVRADAVLDVDGGLIPTGVVRPVAGTAFDFRAPRSLRAAVAADPAAFAATGGFDHCYRLAGGQEGPSAVLRAADGSLAMAVETDEPGLQVYGGQGLAGAHPGLPPALCLEPQDLPDAMNQPAFPPVVLRPGQPWGRIIRYRLA